MMGFDFGIIGKYMAEYFDTDEIDIFRAREYTLSDGSIGMTATETPLYTGVKCHLALNGIDGPEASAAGTDHVNISVAIYCGVEVDLHNKDMIHARKMSADGRVLEEYVGAIGMPATDQSRKKAIMTARRVTGNAN